MCVCVCVRACASNKPSERLFTQVFAWSGVVEDAVGEGGRLPTRRALPRGVTNITQIHKIIKIHDIVNLRTRKLRMGGRLGDKCIIVQININQSDFSCIFFLNLNRKVNV